MDPTQLPNTATDAGIKYALGLLKRHGGYLYHYKDNFKELSKYHEDLIRKRLRVQNQVKEAERTAEEIEADVQNWLGEVKQRITEIEEFLDGQDHAKTACSIGFIPKNLWFRYRLGREAKKKFLQYKENYLLNETFDRVAHQAEPRAATAALINSNYQCFKSREQIMDKIIDQLKDSSVRMIGVHGPGGVGKTTLVKQVAKKAKDSNLFNVVIMVTITSNPDMIKIQGEIADMLGLRLEIEKTEIGRADRLRQRLKNEKKTLIILDDLWQKLELNKLGIHFDNDDFGQMVRKHIPDSSDEKRCKILLISREREVLSTQMDVKDDLISLVERLDEQDALTLFKNKAEVSDISSESAQNLETYFAGLPMAIVTLAGALKKKTNSEKDEALKKLEKQEFSGVQNAMELSVKKSYDHLESEELKSTFLLCARISHNPSIMNLVKHCIGLGILNGVHTVKDARKRVDALIKKLKNSCLLMDSDSSVHFNMHDSIRDAALLVAYKEQNVFTLRNGKLDDWPDNDELERFTAISLHNCDITDELPEGINFPQLKVFHIDFNDPSIKIPDNFFEGMRKLRVLMLTGNHISHLPSSIKCLSKLRMLCLEQCLLRGNLSIIGELKKLKILTFSGSEIENLPGELGQLSSLQLFDITNCSKLGVIPPKVIPNWVSLEELYMRNGLIEREGDENQIQSAILDELKHLTRLTTLDICIPNVAALPRNLFLDRLEDYKIVIGDLKRVLVGEFRLPHMYEASKALALQLKEGSDIHSQNGIKMLFKKAEKLFVGELNGVRNFFYEMNLEGFPCLEHLSIVNNSSIHYIINSEELLHPLDAFPNLKLLCLYQLKNLRKLCCSQLTDFSFNKLKAIKIKTCAELKNLFPCFMVRFLTKLESIEVSECVSLEEIVVEERQGTTNNGINEDDKIEFPLLRSLTLRSLPALTGFYNIKRVVSITQSLGRQSPNTEHNEITAEEEHGGGASLSLFNEQVSIPKLEHLELCSIESLEIWCHHPPGSFENLITLDVKDCTRLTYLLSFSMAKGLVNLKRLLVSGCEKMNAILRITDTDESKEDSMFTKLKEIQLTGMDSLTTIWYAQVSPDSFPNLGSVVIEECKILVNIFPSHMVGKFQSIDTLKIVNCESVEEIFDLNDLPQGRHGKESCLRNLYIEALPNLKHVWNRDPEGILDFKNIQSIVVKDCPSLKNLLPVSVAEGLQNLENFEVIDCNKMEEIVAKEEGSETSTVPFEFPRLNSLSFGALPELTRLYPGSRKLEWPGALKELVVDKCDKLKAFAIEDANEGGQQMLVAAKVQKVISNLEVMKIGLKEATWLRQFSGNCRMHSLKELWFNSVASLDLLHSLLHRVPNLETLILFDCELKELVPLGGLGALAKIGTVVQLKSLVLYDLPALRNIGFEHDPVLQRLERLILYECPLLINLAPSSVSSLTHLTYLKVKRCEGLKNLMTSSVAESLVQLITLKVVQSELMEEVVSTDGNKDEAEAKIVFSKLTTLELVTLTNLTSFCRSRNHAFHFPSLERVVVKDCPKMKMFSMGVTETPNLRQVYAEKVNDDKEEEKEGKWYWEGDLNATIKKIFTDMVYGLLTILKLSELPELEQVWLGKVPLPDSGFGNLKTLVVENHEFLSEVIPFYLLASLKSLKELEVRNCRRVKVIFDMNYMWMTETKVTASCLSKLTLDELPNLTHVWNKNPHGIIGFDNLRTVNVARCGVVRTLFPASVAKNLVKLETLEIKFCEALEVIIGKEEAATEGCADKFEFPLLVSLTLQELPKLMCFYSGSERFNIECPKLKCLHVYHCGKLEVFTSESQSFNESHPDHHVELSTSALPLFLVQKNISNLETLSLNEKDTKVLRRGEFQENLFDKLKVLKLLCFHNRSEEDVLPYEVFQKVRNVEELTIECTTFKQIFPSQTLEVDHIRQLRSLKLENLSELISIGLEHSWLDLLRENLQLLHVQKCRYLTKLVQSAVSFSNLKELHIFECHGLVYLFTSSTAISLERLERLIVWNCKSLDEIVAEEGDESIPEEITFEKLSDLQLLSLPGLQGFHTGNFYLNFPALKRLYINGCRRMKTFSPEVRATVLAAVTFSTEPYDWCWAGDLNHTIQKMFPEQAAALPSQVKQIDVAFVSPEEAENHGYFDLFHDNPVQLEIWQCLRPVNDKFFSNLTLLVVKHCKFLSDVIPSNLLPLLSSLAQVIVASSDSVKAIFDMKDIEEYGEISFSLKNLTLENLPNLEHVWKEDPQGTIQFQDLQEVHVDQCDRLQYLFPATLARGLVKLEELDIRCCVGLVEIVRKDESTAEGASENSVFPRMVSLILGELPNLKYFYPGLDRKQVRLPLLKELELFGCPNLNPFSYESPKLSHWIDKMMDFAAKFLSSNLQMMNFAVEFLSRIMNQEFFKVDWIYWRNSDNPEENKTDEFSSFERENLQAAESPSHVEHLELHGQPEDVDLVSPEMMANYGHFILFHDNPVQLEIWHCLRPVKDGFFTNLKSLVCKHCKCLSDVIPSNLLPLLRNLTEVTVASCDSVKAIFHMKDVEEYEKIRFSLKKLTLEKLPNLEHVWNEDPQETTQFQDLQEVHVDQCDRLQYLFPATLARGLVKLEELEIKSCERFVNIVRKDKATAKGKTKMFVFPLMVSVILGELPSLMYFYPGLDRQQVHLPLLKELEVYACPNLNPFRYESPKLSHSIDKMKNFAAKFLCRILNQEFFKVDWIYWRNSDNQKKNMTDNKMMSDGLSSHTWQDKMDELSSYIWQETEVDHENLKKIGQPDQYDKFGRLHLSVLIIYK